MKKLIVFLFLLITCLFEMHAIKVTFYTYNNSVDSKFVIDTNTLILTRVVKGYSLDYSLVDIYTMGEDIQGHVKEGDMILNKIA